MAVPVLDELLGDIVYPATFEEIEQEVVDEIKRDTLPCPPPDFELDIFDLDHEELDHD